jgi:hypothetical protein
MNEGVASPAAGCSGEELVAGWESDRVACGALSVVIPLRAASNDFTNAARLFPDDPATDADATGTEFCINAALAGSGTNAAFAEVGADATLAESGTNATLAEVGADATLAESGANATLAESGTNATLAEFDTNDTLPDFDADARVAEVGAGATLGELVATGASRASAARLARVRMRPRPVSPPVAIAGVAPS